MGAASTGVRRRERAEVWGDLLSPEAVADPYAFFAAMREDHGPVVWSRRHKAWIVTSHYEVARAFRDERLSSDRLTPMERRLDETSRVALTQPLELLRRWMVFQDRPDHGRLRDPVRWSFTPWQVERLEGAIADLAEERLDEVIALGRCDLKATFALPLPAVAIAALLGVPTADRHRFERWSRQLAGVVFGATDDPTRYERAAGGGAEFVEYLTWLISERRRQPGDDLLSALVAGRHTDDGLTDRDLVGTCTLLLFAGHQTTADLITNAALALALHPDQTPRLREDPSLWGPAVEEFLRFDSPNKVQVRRVLAAHERAGQRLEPGELVFLALAGANRDPAKFPDPDRLDLGRNPRSHLAFGFGPHYCLGAALARLQARIALRALVQRFPELELAGDLDWEPFIVARSLKALPVSV